MSSISRQCGRPSLDARCHGAKPRSADYGRKVAAVADNVGEHRYRHVVRSPWRDGEFRVAMAGAAGWPGE